MATLVACPTCKRHARRTEERCPFCGVAISEAIRTAAPPTVPRGLSRAKLYALHAAIATGVASSCGGQVVGRDDAGGPDAVADAPRDVVLGFGDAGQAPDIGAPDVQSDVIIIPPPPYGCVFPEGCGDVKV